MKTLTILQPWADCIIFDTKRVENRSWYTHYRGPMRIHAGKKSAEQWQLANPDGSQIPGSWKRGEIIGECVVVDCIDRDTALARYPDQAEWIHGPYCWILADVRAYEKSIPAKGALGLWES